MTAVEIGKKIKAKEITVADAVEAAIAPIERVEENVHSFVRIDKEGARKRAEEVQKMINDGTLTGPLAGVPVRSKIIYVRRVWRRPAALRFWKVSNQPLQRKQL